MKNFLPFLAIALLAVTAAGRAQDYPYDDVELNKDEAPALSSETPGAPPETNAPAASKGKTEPAKTALRGRRNPALFRVGIKAGGTYAIFQNPDAVDPTRTLRFTGFGYEAGLALGWDLPYQPVFIEFETGYRSLLMTAGDDVPTLHVIPLSLGLHYRSRLARNALWKPGFRSSLDIRIAQSSTDAGNTFGIFPAVSLTSLFEIENFLIEPLVTISRLQSQYNFVAFALRMGFRF